MPGGGEIVCHNAFLQARLAAARSQFNSGHWLYLYINNIQPNSATTLAAFDPATFAGSAAINLDGLWSAPAKQQDGEYTISIPPQTYLCTAPASETVYGFYVQSAGLVVLSGRMLEPIAVFDGTTFTLKLQYVDRDFSIGV